MRWRPNIKTKYRMRPLRHFETFAGSTTIKEHLKGVRLHPSSVHTKKKWDIITPTLEY